MRQLPYLWFVLHVACVLCGAQVAHLELTSPRSMPARWPRWDAVTQKRYAAQRDERRWWLIVESELYSNGLGENASPEHAALLREAFRYPRNYARVHSAALAGDAGFCAHCDVPYCPRHWNGASGQPPHCPRGHPR